MYSLKIGRHEFMLGHLNMGAAVQDAEDYGEENVNDRLQREHPLAAHDPFAQGPLEPKQIKAALDRIMLEYGPVCTTTCGTHKCGKNRAKLARAIQ